MTYAEFVSQLFSQETAGPTERFSDNLQLTHALMGLAGESGEALDLVKKTVFYGKPTDRTKLLNELGDIYFYLQASVTAAGSSLEEVESLNREKLLKRYEGGKFSTAAAIERKDVEASATPRSVEVPRFEHVQDALEFWERLGGKS